MYDVSSIDELNANITKILSVDKRQSKSLAALSHGELTFTGEFVNYTMSGKPIQLLLSWIVTSGHEINYDEVIVASVDITAQKHAEEALRQSEENYRLLFHEAPIAIWKQDFSEIKIFLDELRDTGIVDMEAYLRDNPADTAHCLRLVKIIEANPVAMQMHNAMTTAQMEADFDRVVEKDGAQPASLAAISMGKKHFEGIFINRPIVGNPIILMLRWLVMHGHEDTYKEVLVAGVDITDQQRYEQSALENERLTTNFRKEQEHNSLIQRSIAALAHDLRTPLAVIATSKDLMLNYFDKLTEAKRKEKLESIGKQLEFALELLDDTVLSVRGTLNERPFHPSVVHLAKLCKVSIEEVGVSYHAENRLHFINMAKINTVFVDEILVSRVLLNLLSNAIKYSPDGGEIRLELDQTDTNLVIRVIDFGMGMSEETQAHIFEPFYRATELSPTIKGTGLGLSIVHDCVMRHNGQIEVQSRLGFGTTFTVYLPIQQPQPVPVMVG
jgi:signal transduction histidine kinase